MENVLLGVLRGHKRPVNCVVACKENSHLLASGSDDSTVRLWDLRTQKVAQCISKVFGRDGITSIAFPSNNVLYAASLNQLYMFDLRNQSMILTEATKIFEPLQDEINTLHAHPILKKKPWLAVPDDDGNIGIVNLQTNQLQTTLRGQHANICMCAAFRPKCAGYDLVTGGLDCNLVFWEMNGDRGGGRVRHRMNMQQLLAENTLSDARQMCNPPFIHDVAFNALGRMVAAALGDGSVALVDFGKRNLVKTLSAHQAAATCVQFASLQAKEYLLSAANDAKIAFWDYKAALENDEYVPHMIQLEHRPNTFATHVQDNAMTLYIGDDTTSNIAMYQVQ
ncbi:hypothetical protein THRCLA_04549 [Thraustotheca clavata]|uniref:Anaphase-promoting complex subunit 4-like WD40 domain-containing protein n=1 Tax=Thraustotheca clavata TaxID=74557 RepID=A0A1V9ZYX3_9STRA|nr:hypothetical protein THRCLA_04549 [Thraustotheca clavata]